MNKTVILIAGPTASGKTSLAIHLAQHFRTAIISADSRQCFKEISIGVAKPTVEELKVVPHYFINTHSVHDTVTAAGFEAYALDCAEKLFREHDALIMAGGTGLYINAFLNGMDEIPAVDETIRMQLTALYEANGISWLQKELQRRDPLFAASGAMQNPQRMLRALEVLESTGQSIVHYQKGIKKKRPFHTIKIGLDLPREELYDRINHRVDIMIKDGLLQEVQGLLHLQHLNALQTVGYRELFDYFKGEINLDTAISKIKQNTRHYAKRQLTWFKRDEEIKWFHPQELHDIETYIQQQLKSPA
ncbi:tRNA (adenosine(37)-N6)-dimethylallyltransferase MiaA [Lacibacter sp. MH-610]|uniref:tRNA (adenosine(37)-N6)-dimethylallyltransferase MiaA n=1 Tax=Lacibacter sp. MH-610 TaxID=3020883 RepID=UPI003891EDAE